MVFENSPYVTKRSYLAYSISSWRHGDACFCPNNGTYGLLGCCLFICLKTTKKVENDKRVAIACLPIVIAVALNTSCDRDLQMSLTIQSPKDDLPEFLTCAFGAVLSISQRYDEQP